MADVADVEASRRDVGGHQDVQGAVAEAAHDPVALLLRQAAVERGRVPSAAGERLGEVVHLAPGPGEDERRRAVLEVQDPAQRRQLVRAPDDVRDLPNAGVLALGLRRLVDADPDGVVQVALGEARDLPGDGRGEERGLALLAQGAEDLVQVVGEAHVEHLVGLVEDDRLHLVEAERAAIEVVHRPARRRHDHVHAACQAGQLRGDRLAAVDRDDAHAEVPPVAMDGLGHLHRELPGGCEDQRRRPAATTVTGDPATVDRGAGLAGGVHAAGEVLEDRQREGGRLAGAGGGLRQQVPARQQGRDRDHLDGRGLLVAEAGERAQEPRVEVQGGEPGGRAGSGGGPAGSADWSGSGGGPGSLGGHGGGGGCGGVGTRSGHPMMLAPIAERPGTQAGPVAGTSRS